MGRASIAALVNDYVAALKRWGTDVAALGKAEMSDQGKRAGIGAGLFGAAGFLAFLASIMVTVAVALALISVGMWPWVAFAVVAFAYLGLAGIFALIGKGLVSALKGPRRTIAAIKAGPGIPLGGDVEGTPTG